MYYNLRITLLIALWVVGVLPCGAQQVASTFQGHIAFARQLTGADSTRKKVLEAVMPTQFTFELQAKRCRITAVGGMFAGVELLDYNSDTASCYFIISPEKKAYRLELLPPDRALSPLTPTGKSEKIAGHLCLEFTARQKGASGKAHEVALWLAPEMPIQLEDRRYQLYLPAGAQTQLDNLLTWAQPLHMLPLRVVLVDATQGTRLTYQATEVTPGPVAATLFQVPAGIPKFNFIPR